MLYFGSFNPIHKGHIEVAEWILQRGICDEIWFVVSPHNPLKDAGMLIPEGHRLAMVSLAVEESPYARRMLACDVEFSLPRPSYTIDTLEALKSLYPDIMFSILMGSDILGQIERWKEWRKIVNEYKIYVYPRRGYPVAGFDTHFVILEGASYRDFSSTQVRESIGRGCEDGMLSEKVGEYIKRHELWTTAER